VTVTLSADTASAGKSFSVSLQEHLQGDVTDVPAKATGMDGKSLPRWLTFDAQSKKFSAKNVPTGAFPLQVKVVIGKVETVVVFGEESK
jgi:hypothetical protein